jgi:hypothetical protein
VDGGRVPSRDQSPTFRIHAAWKLARSDATTARCYCRDE